MRQIDRDSLPHMVACLCELVRSRWWDKFWMVLAAHWWGVRLGHGCSFIGFTWFRRHPRSRIVIGPGCQFRSSHASNPSGINRPCLLTTMAEGAEIEIGPNCGFSGTAIACSTKISFGESVRCSPNTWIIDTDGHHHEDPRTGPDAPVSIGNGVWLGANVSVMKGVSIGDNTVVAAGSMVTRSLPANVVAGGVPAKVLKQIDTHQTGPKQ
jgi:acetyltransferase-like isoleucine patch superfamily enzyme